MLNLHLLLQKRERERETKKKKKFPKGNSSEIFGIIADIIGIIAKPKKNYCQRILEILL